MAKKVQRQRCEGWVRHGGAFTLGPVTWEQCPNDATIMLTVVRKKGDKLPPTLPACGSCWQRCIDDTNIKIVKVELIKRPRKG
jgi:hypothetical protein